MDVDQALDQFVDGHRDHIPWIAFSGGRDSSVLLHAVARRQACRAVHVNHGLSEAAGEWQRHCRDVCRVLDVAFEAISVAIGPGNLEAEARRARYTAMETLLTPGEVLLTAHHANDQAETRLWQLMTGRPPAGMPATRPLGGGVLERPLIGVTSEAIDAYAREHRLSWCEDPMNDDASLDRVFVRERLLPLIAARDGHAVRKMAAGVPALPPAAVIHWLERALGRRVERSLVRSIERLEGHDRGVVQVDRERVLWRHQAVWSLRPATPAVGLDFACTVGEPACQKTGTLTWLPASPGLRWATPLTASTRRGAVRVRDQHKSVKDLLRQARVAPWHRPTWPVLHRDGEIVSVVGIATDETSLVTNGYLPQWTPSGDEIDRFVDPA